MEWLFFFALRGKDDNEWQIFFSLFRQNCLYPVAFTFIAYETADKGLHLESSDAANGYWTLTQKNDKGETLSYKFELCPFFANAYTVVEKPDTGAAGGAAGEEKAELGKDSLPYEMRSLAQLQYINWSYAKNKLSGSTTANVTSSTYKYFPYLQYTSSTDKAEQSRADAEKSSCVQLAADA